MKKIFALLCLPLFSISFISGQDVEKYYELAKTAATLYESKEYLKSGEKYSEAFEFFKGKGTITDRYKAACSWAMANRPDSAFVQLFKVANNGKYSNVAHIASDTALLSLHHDDRWSKLLEIVKDNKKQSETTIDKSLVAILDTVFQDDQKYRQQIKGIQDKYGWDSDEMKAQWKLIQEKDSINQIKVKKILDERGWLGPDVIGNQGNSTLFLVIQHADIETQEKYLPMMREALTKGNAIAPNLALLEDRIALRKGGRQIYGSQIGQDQETKEYYVLPLEDPDNVDQRRAKVGLGKIQDYIANWGLTWDAEAYKKKLPEIEAKQKN